MYAILYIFIGIVALVFVILFIKFFGLWFRALLSGAPPHGGVALGVDRLVAQFVGAGSLRDVIAFPKTTAARALYEGAPSPVTDTDLSGLGLSLGTTLQQSEVRRETE